MPIDKKATRTFSYGLFVLTARDGEKDNGCVVNTVQQVSGSPLRISVAVNKENLTHDMIAKTGLFNVSVLDRSAPMSLFERFGFQSGRTADKFADYPAARSENGLAYLTGHANAFFSGKVVSALDCGTHTLFLADVTEAGVLSGAESVTYQYYFDHIKPKPAAKKKGWVCKICGYVYEGDELPADFVCPLCKHGAEDFEPLEPNDKKEEEKTMKKYVCDVCGWTYDEAAGDPEHGITPGTKWEDLPADFECPVCGVGKDSFSEE